MALENESPGRQTRTENNIELLQGKGIENDNNLQTLPEQSREVLPSLTPATIEKEINKDPFEELFARRFIPNRNNRPPQVPPIITVDDIGILTRGNIVSIIASPGSGKSSVCEAALSSFLLSQSNIEADTLRIKVSNESCKGIYFFDFERTEDDVWKSYDRIANRGKVPYNKEPENAMIVGMRDIPRLDERKKIIDKMAEGKEGWILIIDGAGDTVSDTNDLAQAVESRVWMRELIAKNKLSGIITTIHPNPGSQKPRGHQGSELTRESETVLIIKGSAEGGRILTSDFTYGKNRNNRHATTAFAWSDEHHMFMSADADAIAAKAETKAAIKKKAKLIELAEAVLPGTDSLSYTALCIAIGEIDGVEEPTAKRKIKEMAEAKIIKKHEGDGKYRRNI